MRRLLIIIILLLTGLSAGAQGGSTILDGMKTVSERFGVHFVYESSLPLNTHLDGNPATGKTLRDSLHELFDDSTISWQIKGKYVLLSSKKPVQIGSQLDTLKAATITGIIDRNQNFTQTGLTKLDGAAFNRAFAVFSAPDVLKTLQALPGVASGTELLSSLYVHGGDGTDNLFLLDGVPLYQICHLGGIFSSFNTDVIENLDFYKSGFPARYGGRTSSVVDVQTRDGDFEHYKGLFSIGLIEGRAQIEGPIVKGKTSFNVALRRSWADAVMYPACLINNRKENKDRTNGVSSKVFGYAFTDLNARVTHKFSSSSKLTANFYWGNDAFNYIDKDRTNYTEKGVGHIDSFTNINMSWGNTLASLNWKKQFSDDMSLCLTGYWSGSRAKISYVSGYDIDMSFPDGYKHVSEETQTLSNHNVLDDTGVSADAIWKPNEAHTLRFGGNGTWHSYRPDYSYIEDSVDNGIKGGYSQNDTVRVSGWEGTLYVEDEMRITPWLRANVGLRNTLYGASGKVWNSFEPRLALKVQCSPDVNIKASYSEMSQFSHQVASTYLDLPTNCWLPSGNRVAPMRSRQVAAGVYGKLPWNMHLTVEGWYKTMDNLIEYTGMNTYFPRLDDWEENFKIGKGRSYGMEVDFGYETEALTLNAFYTLSWNERLFEDIWPTWFRDRNDNRHKITLQANWRINKKWELYSAWNYHSGNRMTVPTHYIQGMYYGTQDYQLRSMWVYEEPNNVKIPDYHRLDIGANLHGKTKRGHEYIWNISIYNVYCRINPIYASAERRGVKRDDPTFDPGYVSFVGKGYGIVPIVPTFNYTIKF
ncbi:MAG: TonB-dependent receptor plug domain-containing protein [Bacteroidales bacterium]|nr:TonB-dependent receptor plug domain-containing protein [Bacteroidales bacterium]